MPELCSAFCVNAAKRKLVDEQIIMNTSLPRVREESELVEFSENERRFQLTPDALTAWKSMKHEAIECGIALRLISAFRSVDRQREIIENKRKNGLSDEAIYKVNAPPGFSEHHSGNALDLSTDGYRPLEEVFEKSKAFKWLEANGARFGFSLSYSRGNEYGIAYEPWHWLFEKSPQVSRVSRRGKRLARVSSPIN